MQMLLTAVLTLLLGILLLVMPGIAVETLFLVLGWILTITGVTSILSALLHRGKPVGQGDLVLGLLEVATGLVVLTKPTFLVSVAGILLGLLLIMHGARNVQSARESRAMGYKNASLARI